MPATSSASSRLLPIHFAILAALGLCLSCLWGGVTWSLAQAKRAAVDKAYIQADGAAAELAAETRHLLEHADQVATLVRFLAASDATVNFPVLARNTLLLDNEHLSEVTLVDQTGLVLDSTYWARGSWMEEPAELNFRCQPLETQALRIGSPYRDSTESWVVPGFKPITDASGNCMGTVLVTMRPSLLLRDFSIEGYTDAAMGVLTSEGVFLARKGRDGLTVGAQIPVSRLDSAPLKGGVRHAEPGAIDGVLRYRATARVGIAGLTALVGIPEEEALVTYFVLRRHELVAAGSVTAVLLLAAWAFMRQATRLRQTLARKREAERNYVREKELLQVTLRSIVDAVVTTDRQGQVTYLNPKAETLTGWSSVTATGLPSSEIVNLVEPATGLKLDLVARALESTTAVSLNSEGTIHSLSGAQCHVEFTVAPIYNDAQLEGAVMVVHDVSNAKKLAHELSHQATHDALTGLPNRIAFDARMDAALLSAATEDASHVVMFLDLDQFKVVNDSCGHVAGDELLRQLTHVLSQLLRKGDTLARLGGDEFAVLLTNCSRQPALRVAETLREAVAEFKYIWQDRAFQIGVSIGLVPFEGDVHTRTELLRMADTACYLAKDQGRNRVHVYDAQDAAVSQREGELSWASRLQRALNEDRFVLQGQKILALSSGHVCETYEMLVRLREDDGRLVPPMAFIPAAERYGMMNAIDRRVIDKALALYAQTRASRQNLRFCINLSGASMTDTELPTYVAAKLTEHGVPARGLCFEVTETAAISNMTVAVQLMTQLKALGCDLALDDFGSGMASFAYLKQLPVDYVKIDGSFVRNMLTDAVDFAMVESIHNIARRMGLGTVAEFVESSAIEEALRTMGVGFAQGFGVERPRFLLPEAVTAPVTTATQAVQER